jgi:hypothetical protein
VISGPPRRAGWHRRGVTIRWKLLGLAAAVALAGSGCVMPIGPGCAQSLPTGAR